MTGKTLKELMEISACITHSFYLILFLTMPKRVIVDPEILFQAYNPEYIFFREKDKRRIISFLINSINTFVYGPMGSGKTVLMKSIVREMELRMTYVNSALAQTTNSILKEILSEINPLGTIPKTNSVLINKLRRYLRTNKLTVCLDHFQHIKELDVVDKLINMNANVVLVAEDRKEYFRLSKFARMNITNMFEIKPYSTEQVFSILVERARLALRDGSYDEELLMEIAKRSKGNVTVALSLLRASIVRAEMENREKVSIEDIPNFIDESQELSDDELILLEILREHKRVKGSELYRLYYRKSKNPKTPRSVRKYMQSLRAKGLVRCIGAKRWRIYEFKGD